jgi:thiosulfate/3-mercaptopyruvate sulfurtransferase
VEPLAPYEKVFVNPAFLKRDAVHGSLGCEYCHGGDPSEADYESAHTEVVKDPSLSNLDKTCGTCHADISERYKTSLHATLQPYVRTIDMRATRNPLIKTQVDEARERHCMSCHASCGECHVSRPKEVDGGLLQGHTFKKRPPMRETCTACHGSRIDREYFGKNEGIPADVHRLKNMQCINCHNADELHGDGNDYANRYEVTQAPKCVDCHEQVYEETSANYTQHVLHRDRASCQVCHAAEYKSCYRCHVGTDEKGLTYFQTLPSEIGFKIGLNPLRSERRPEKFVTVRHIPVDQDTFAHYVDDGLANFEALPTWKMATPHTIQRMTPQNASCDSCHGSNELFLQEDDVRPQYLEANRNVIVPPDQIPK